MSQMRMTIAEPVVGYAIGVKETKVKTEFAICSHGNCVAFINGEGELRTTNFMSSGVFSADEWDTFAELVEEMFERYGAEE